MTSETKSIIKWGIVLVSLALLYFVIDEIFTDGLIQKALSNADDDSEGDDSGDSDNSDNSSGGDNSSSGGGGSQQSNNPLNAGYVPPIASVLPIGANTSPKEFISSSEPISKFGAIKTGATSLKKEIVFSPSKSLVSPRPVKYKSAAERKIKK